MFIRFIAVVVELLLASASSASVIRSYQDFSLSECPVEAVCSEIYSLASLNLTPSYLNTANCQCPVGSYCPTEPGHQTLNVGENKWYGLCRPATEIPQCEPGDIAEEIHVHGFGGKNLTKVHCVCPSEDSKGVWGRRSAMIWAGTSSDSSNTKLIHHLMCSVDFMAKRGRFGESSRGRNRGRFYFYRK